MRIIGIPWFRGGVVVGGPVLVSVGVDWFRCCGVIRGSVRGFGRLCGRCAGGCSPCVYEIVGIPRFCGGAVVGSPVSVWTGSVFGLHPPIQSVIWVSRAAIWRRLIAVQQAEHWYSAVLWWCCGW